MQMFLTFVEFFLFYHFGVSTLCPGKFFMEWSALYFSYGARLEGIYIYNIILQPLKLYFLAFVEM